MEVTLYTFKSVCVCGAEYSITDTPYSGYKEAYSKWIDLHKVTCKYAPAKPPVGITVDLGAPLAAQFKRFTGLTERNSWRSNK